MFRSGLLAITLALLACSPSDIESSSDAREVVDAALPGVDAPKPSLDAPLPTIDAPLPAIDAPLPSLDAPLPSLDAPPASPDAASSPDAPAPSPDAATEPDGGPLTTTPGTILFVTQVPWDGFASVSSTFANHDPSMQSVPRGGDLMLRYPDGTLRNLTREAGYGNGGRQGASSIAVREPEVHWSGEKAIFAMVVGAPTEQYEYETYHWQLYEVTGLAKGDTAVITKVVNQPAGYNNISPIYAADDRIVFTSDRPRSGEAHHYPQLDEYESTISVSGLWRLDPPSGELVLLQHAPSGSFSPLVDSFGRILFIRWDHLQRDQQADADRDGDTFGSFTYADESAGASKIASLDGQEVFPEPRDDDDPTLPANVSAHRQNQFLPWMINVDGTGEETLNHLGRHELGGSYTEAAFLDDPNLTYNTPESTHANRFYVNGDGGMLHLAEDGKVPGRYWATVAREFGTASGGMLIRFDAAPTVNPEETVLVPITHPDCRNENGPGSTGHYRNPLGLSDGMLIVSHADEKGLSTNLGSRASPSYNHKYRLKTLVADGNYYKAGAPLTAGIKASISWWDPDVLVTWEGDLWELDAVEVRPRARPSVTPTPLPAAEKGIFTSENVDEPGFRAWLAASGLALIVSRNVTYRDRADVQQPYNLRVPGGAQTMGKAGKLYDITHFQIFQADALRGYGGVADPREGRRQLARPMHGAKISPTPVDGPPGSVALGLDGSMAALVPASRALSWQTTGPGGVPVVRERNWVTFAPGEIRVCTSCHGLNKMNQAGAPDPTNPPEALRTLLKAWKTSLN